MDASRLCSWLEYVPVHIGRSKGTGLPFEYESSWMQRIGLVVYADLLSQAHSHARMVPRLAGRLRLAQGPSKVMLIAEQHPGRHQHHPQ